MLPVQRARTSWHLSSLSGRACWLCGSTARNEVLTSSLSHPADVAMPHHLRRYNALADIWSFGITVLELAHGHAPFARFPPMKAIPCWQPSGAPVASAAACAGMYM